MRSSRSGEDLSHSESFYDQDQYPIHMRLQSSCAWNILKPIPYAKSSVSIEYGNLGRNKARTCEEYILFMNILNELGFSYFSSNV